MFNKNNNLLIVQLSLMLINSSITGTSESFKCYMDTMGGTVPSEACFLRDFFKELSTHGQSSKQVNKIWMFYGEGGTGKTSGTKAIAHESDTIIKSYLARHIMDDNISMSKKLYTIFEEAEEIASKKIPVIILIDEVDVLQKNESKEFFATLRTYLDQANENGYIAVILISNVTENVGKDILGRCTRVEWPIPNLENRKAIIKFYANKYNLSLDKRAIDSLSSKANKFSGRDIVVGFGHAKTLADGERKNLNQMFLEKAFEEITKEKTEEKKSWFTKKREEYLWKAGIAALEFGAASATLAAIILGSEDLKKATKEGLEKIKKIRSNINKTSVNTPKVAKP